MSGALILVIVSFPSVMPGDTHLCHRHDLPSHFLLSVMSSITLMFDFKSNLQSLPQTVQVSWVGRREGPGGVWGASACLGIKDKSSWDSRVLRLKQVLVQVILFLKMSAKLSRKIFPLKCAFIRSSVVRPDRIQNIRVSASPCGQVIQSWMKS